MAIVRGCLVFLLLVTWVAVPSAVISGAKAAFVVVVDAGHGGHDNGATGYTGTLEKDVVLEVVKLIRMRSLSMPEIDVVLTRTDDLFIELSQRTAIANQLQADLYVSVHANAHNDIRANGVETWVSERLAGDKRKASLTLASSLQAALLQQLSPVRDRGVKAQHLYLRHADMPSALVELGFLTNPVEEVALTRLSYQVKAADAVLQGILDYLNNK